MSRIKTIETKDIVKTVNNGIYRLTRKIYKFN